MHRNDIRNVAIIAHVDHGKTTLLDGLLRQTHTVETRKAPEERIMDRNDQERERGITILAKNTGIAHGECFINIVDTPGHADLGGQVERILNMVDGALLLVDAFDGPMPQTRFVLSKALAMGLTLIVLINKIDRPGARPKEVLSAVYDLFIDLGADEKQLEFPVLYTSAKLGYALRKPEDAPVDLTLLLDTIVARVPPPEGSPDLPLQFMVSAVEYDPYLGRLLIGRVRRGRLALGQQVAHLARDGALHTGKVTQLFGFRGLERDPRTSAAAGDVVAVAGVPDATVGETLADPENPESLPGITVSQPTVTMTFRVNDSPFAGQEGRYVTSRHLRARLEREQLSDVALEVEEAEQPDEFRVSGRGVLHLSILIENMRREGYELAVSRPTVIDRVVDGQRQEPVEELILDLTEASMGAVMEALGPRKAELLHMTPLGNGRMRLQYSIPTRTLMGFRSEYLTLTRGEGIMTHAFLAYQLHKGVVRNRKRGVLISMGEGEAVAYAIWQLQERGTFIVPPHTRVYGGMIVGFHSRENDLVINVLRKKQLTNVRASGHDDAIRIVPHLALTLEQSLEIIEDDELVEVTPASIRLRKRILNTSEREALAKRNRTG
ncbi:MAG: translational GTPase TypA [Candidatus Lambdaproteobacteria bacterium]|nr:translational GTPase TypA [Candidatus Lambdaproteobacteria bacterium]